MLKRFRVNNFRSLLNFEFYPVGVNLLIGPNNAGKTNLCSALRFLSWSSYGSLERAVQHAVGEVWNLTNVHVDTRDVEFQAECELNPNGVPLVFQYKLKLNSASPSGPVARQELGVVEETLRVADGRLGEKLLLENRGGHARVFQEGPALRSPEEGVYIETVSAPDATMLSRLYPSEANPRATLFKKYLSSWQYFALAVESLRSPNVDRKSWLWDAWGGGLCGALHQLHNENPRMEKAVIEAVRRVEPRLELFSYVSPDPNHVYLFMEDDKGHRFSSRAMSDGTLRFLAVAYLVVSVGQWTRDWGFSPLVIIEEPENGVYVRDLKSLFERIDRSGKAGQFIFTSHDPYFVDLFDSCPEGIHVLKRGIPSSEIVKPDPAKIRELLAEMPLGEMHFRELLAP